MIILILWFILLYLYILKASKTLDIKKKIIIQDNMLITPNLLNNGLANKIFNIVESMLVAYRTRRCLYCKI